MSKLKVSKEQLSEMIKKSITKVMNEEKQQLKESEAMQLLQIAGGVGIVGLTSVALAKFLEALESGKLGETGQKVAKLLNVVGSQVNSGVTPKESDYPNVNNNSEKLSLKPGAMKPGAMKPGAMKPGVSVNPGAIRNENKIIKVKTSKLEEIIKEVIREERKK